MHCKSLQFSRHAVQRMFQRSLSAAAVTAVVGKGEVVEDYPNDFPYPSCLLLGIVDGVPCHVVASRNPATSECFVITVYVPDPTRWSADFKTRMTP